MKKYQTSKESLLNDFMMRIGSPKDLEAHRKLAWNLFMETAYQALQDLNEAEKRQLSVQEIRKVQTDIQGVAELDLDHSAYTKIDSLSVIRDPHKIPINELSVDEYLLMLSNENYRPYGDEYWYIAMGGKIDILTSYINASFYVHIVSTPDIISIMGNMKDKDPLPLHNMMVSRIMPVAVEKTKEAIGLML